MKQNSKGPFLGTGVSSKTVVCTVNWPVLPR